MDRDGDVLAVAVTVAINIPQRRTRHPRARPVKVGAFAGEQTGLVAARELLTERFDTDHRIAVQ